MTDDAAGGLTPEQEARREIDAQLVACGWVLQDHKSVAVAAAQGVAVREVSVGAGRADYVLFVDRQAVGVIEAKPVGTTLTGVEPQTLDYQKSYFNELPAFKFGEASRIRGFWVCWRRLGASCHEECAGGEVVGVGEAVGGAP